MAGVKVVYILGKFENFKCFSTSRNYNFKLLLSGVFGQNSPKCCQFYLTSDDMEDDASDMLRFLFKY